jgi:hypothetical protein
VRLRQLPTLLLPAVFAAACVGAPAVPTIVLPTIDTTALQQRLDSALAEVGNLTANPPQVELPPDLAAFLDEHQIQLPPLPSNAQEICNVMGFPGASTVAGAGLGAALEMLAGLEFGLVVGLIVAVVFKTCPLWSPHLVDAFEELL